MSGALEALDAVGRGGKAKKAWSQAPYSPLPRTVLAFDQSLSATGWAVLTETGPVRAGVIRTDPQKGNEGTLSRAVEIAREAEWLMRQYHGAGATIVHEAPPATYRGMHRGEASLVAATAIRIAADRGSRRLVMISAQAAKRRMTGDANAPKARVKEAVTEMFGDLGLKPWNEHVRDAVILGVLAMESPDGN